ncbi:hypothetical protein F4809DRAFT_261694 [Biscogniauxia mediterranea]|nr:hypothetical protein F4809DRAFT_261694 [Biscogniauxia mediterranea]
MLRMFRSRPNVFSLGARVNGTQGPKPQTVRIQQVRIRRRWFKPRNFFIAAAIYYGCYQVYSRFVFGTLGSWLDEQEAQLTENERKELDEELSEPLFIPFPGTTKVVEPPPYRGSDPEWRTFIKINKDDARVRAIQNDLAELVRRTAVAHPGIVHKCGNDLTVVKHWLDVNYPYKPPPTFVRKGLRFDDVGIWLAEQPVDSFVVFRLRRTLWPSALTISLWSFSGALLKQNALHVAKVLGFEPKTVPVISVQETLNKFQQQLKKPPSRPDAHPSASLPPTSSGAADESPVSRSASSPTPPDALGSGTSIGSVLPTVPTAQPGKPKSAKDIYMVKMTQEHTSGPWETFKRKFSQSWQPLKDYPPRGSFNVSGLVELRSSRALVTVDVNAWWDPKTESFHTRSIYLRLRGIRLKQQSPLR